MASSLAKYTFKGQAATPLPSVSSAGVFDQNGKLVRTLWSSETNYADASNPGGVWDGLLDDGSVAPAGNYNVKVLAHDVTYTWEGVIGNTSPKVDHINHILYHAYGSSIRDMTITAAGEVYFIHGYDERFNGSHVTTEGNIQQAKYVLEKGTQNTPVACCTDGTYVYFAQWLGGNNSRIWACATAAYIVPDQADNAFVKQGVAFPSGTPEGAYGSPIAASTNNEFPLDVAVQQGAGTFLFCSRLGPAGVGYRIWVNHKTTGAAVTTNNLGYAALSSIAIDPITNRLWVMHSTGGTLFDKVSEMAVSVGGVLTETGVHITGLTDGLDLEVSPDGSYILVTDVGTQQIKAFNTSNGSVKTAWATNGVFGVAGGYVGSPAVANNKFMFFSSRWFSDGGGFIAFSSDLSFWVGDSGNYRNLHFSSGNTPTYIERIAYVPGYYSCHECQNDPTRVFVDGLEFAIDYDIALGVDNGSWELTYNWSADLPGTDAFRQLKWVGVYQNGRTYTVASTGGQYQVWELISSGARNTGKTIVLADNIAIDTEMNIWYASSPGGGNVAVYYKNDFAGFDGSNNPTWVDDPTVLPTTPAVTTELLPTGFPVIQCHISHSAILGEVLSNGVIPVFNPHGVDSKFYHFGGIKAATGEAMFMAHPQTNLNYGGVNTLLGYPPAPFFPAAFAASPASCGTAVGDNAGGSMFYLAGEDQVFTQYPGEAYGANQTAVTSHWHESGLLINRFGSAAPFFGLQLEKYPFIPDFTSNDNIVLDLANASYTWKGMEGLAGNSFNGGITLVNDKYYLYQNDEWYHGGLHRWCISNLNTILTFDTPVSWDGNFVAPTDANNLLLGLPFDQIQVPNNTAGWVRSPTTNILTGEILFGPWFRVYTNAILPDPNGVPDLVIQAARPGTDCTVTRALPRIGVGNWTITGEVVWRNVLQIVVSILDDTGKVLLKLQNGSDVGQGIYINDVRAILGGFYAWEAYTNARRALVITGNVSTGKMTVTYGQFTVSNISVYEVGADISAPETFKVLAPNDVNVVNAAISLTALAWSEV